MQNLCFGSPNALFQGTEVVKHPFYSIGPKMMLGVFQGISLTFGMQKDAKLVLRARMHYFGVPKL
jgi:hypothetical protein